MTPLMHKIDFAVVLSVHHANPNGDPLNGNRPRQTYSGQGEISDVCLKRKIRNRIQDLGQSILVQSDDRRQDAYRSIKDRVDHCAAVQPFVNRNPIDNEQFTASACATWWDVRSFGQVFAFKKKSNGSKKDNKKDNEESNGVSIGVRGPVSIHSALSVDPIDISSIQITKSVNTETSSNPDNRSSDTMGMKHRVDFGVYVFYGSINVQLAQKTRFSPEDAELLRQALRTLFVNDASSARPEGSMEIHKLYWWEHDSALGQYSAAQVHRSLHVTRKPDVSEPQSIADYDITIDTLEELPVQVDEGI